MIINNNQINYFNNDVLINNSLTAASISAADGNSNQWNTAYAFTTNIPLVTAFKIPNITLGTQGNYTPQGFYTIPTGRMFVVTSISVLFDNGAYVNGGTAVNTRVVVNSGTNSASFTVPQLQLAASTTFPANTLRKTSWSGSDTFLFAVAGDTLHFRVTQAGTAYTATALVEGVLM